MQRIAVVLAFVLLSGCYREEAHVTRWELPEAKRREIYTRLRAAMFSARLGSKERFVPDSLERARIERESLARRRARISRHYGIDLAIADSIVAEGEQRRWWE